MAILVLPSLSAFSSGSDLWFFPFVAPAKAVGRLDWYLNFQKTKSTQHQSQSLSANLKDVLQKTDQENLEISLADTKTLMIAPSQHVPAKWVIFQSGEDNLESWTAQMHKVWDQLGRPTVRFFLPPGLTSEVFQRKWKEVSAIEDYTIVLDS